MDKGLGISELLGKMTRNKWLAAAQAMVIVFCTWVLWFSDAYFMPYLLVSAAALVCLFLNLKDAKRYSKSVIITTGGFSLLFALMITLANYNLWRGTIGIIKCLLALFGTFIAFANILFFIAGRKDSCSQGTSGKSHRRIFLVTFLLIAIVNSAILFLSKYPGFLTLDSVLQVRQTLDGVYTNSHPFYHTMILKFFITTGLAAFGNMNAAIAAYMVFQICFMALSFAFATMTVKEMGAPQWLIIMLIVFFALMPYHIVYSMTLWKDVIFGGIVLLYTVFLYRTLKSMGNNILNAIGMILSGVGFCLLRSNGLIAFVGTTLLFLLLFRFQHKKMVLIMTAVIIASFILKHPVLKAFDVAQPHITESLSIPLQQVARDVIENKDFTDEEYDLINQVADVERIPETYLPYISDPIKELIREHENQQAISDHKSEYIRLYFSRLLKHPSTYVKAWIDQTKGYWNSGYPYWIWCLYADGSELGICNRVNSSLVNKMFNSYLSHFLKFPVLTPLVSIGFFVWCLLLFLYVAVIRKDKALALLIIPSLMVVLSLLVATPVFSEFRYAYSIFCTMPVIGIMTFISCRRSKTK